MGTAAKIVFFLFCDSLSYLTCHMNWKLPPLNNHSANENWLKCVFKLCVLCRNSAWSTRHETLRWTGAEAHTKRVDTCYPHIMTSPHMHTYLPPAQAGVESVPKRKSHESYALVLWGSLSLSQLWAVWSGRALRCSTSPALTRPPFPTGKGHTESSQPPQSGPLGKESLSW